MTIKSFAKTEVLTKWQGLGIIFYQKPSTNQIFPYLYLPKNTEKPC